MTTDGSALSRITFYTVTYVQERYNVNYVMLY